MQPNLLLFSLMNSTPTKEYLIHSKCTSETHQVAQKLGDLVYKQKPQYHLLVETFATLSQQIPFRAYVVSQYRVELQCRFKNLHL